jgi:hypothetical protein
MGTKLSKNEINNRNMQYSKNTDKNNKIHNNINNVNGRLVADNSQIRR